MKSRANDDFRSKKKTPCRPAVSPSTQIPQQTISAWGILGIFPVLWIYTSPLAMRVCRLSGTSSIIFSYKGNCNDNSVLIDFLPSCPTENRNRDEHFSRRCISRQASALSSCVNQYAFSRESHSKTSDSASSNSLFSLSNQAVPPPDPSFLSFGSEVKKQSEKAGSFFFSGNPPYGAVMKSVFSRSRFFYQR